MYRARLLHALPVFPCHVVEVLVCPHRAPGTSLGVGHGAGRVLHAGVEERELARDLGLGAGVDGGTY